MSNGHENRVLLPYGIYMVHTYMMEIKEYDVRAHGHGMVALRKMHGR